MNELADCDVVFFFSRGFAKIRQSRLLLKYRYLPSKEVHEEVFSPSRGKGGTALNAATNGCRVTHLPTGLQVRCDSTRDLDLNRKLAHTRLHDLVEDKLNPNTSRIARKHKKIRKRNAKRRSRALKKYGKDGDEAVAAKHD